MKNIDEKELHELFEKMRKNDKQSYEELYKKYYNLVYNISFSILKNKENAEDIVQNVFIKIGNLNQEKLPSNYEASWLYTVTKNECISFIRKTREVLAIDENLKDNQNEEEIEKIIQNNSYEKLVENLEQIEKQIIFLKIEAGYSFKEISRLLNMPIGTVQWKYYKSLNSLKLLITNLSMFVIGAITCLFNDIRLKKQKSTENVNVVSEETGQNDNKINENKTNDNTKQEIAIDNTANENSANSTNENSIREDNSRMNSEQNNMENKDIENENMVENTINQDYIQDYMKENNTNQISSIVLYGLTSIFLCLSIFFTIIIIKDQQKGKRKASKR